MYTGGTTPYPKAVMWQHKDRIAVIGMARADDAAEHAERRLSLATNGNVIAERRPVVPKTLYDDGTTHVVLSPLEFIGRLAARLPRPRVKLTGTPSRDFTAFSLLIASFEMTLFPNNPSDQNNGRNPRPTR